MNAITTHFDRLTVGEPVVSGSMFMFPLFAADTEENWPVTVDEAVSAELLDFEEVSITGLVPEISVTNRGSKPVLLLDGEQILGLKQNRTFNLSMLVPAGATVTAPVSCLEMGRWSADSARPRTAEHVHFARGRSDKLRTVSESLARDGTYRSDQISVWEKIGQKGCATGTYSATSAEADVFEGCRASIEALRTGLNHLPGQIGAVFGIGSQLVGLDVFDSHKIYASLHEKLLKSYLLDAVEESAPASAPAPATVLTAVRLLFDGEEARFHSPGAGETLRWSSAHGCAAVLVAEERCLHAVGYFSKDTANSAESAAA